MGADRCHACTWRNNGQAERQLPGRAVVPICCTVFPRPAASSRAVRHLIGPRSSRSCCSTAATRHPSGPSARRTRSADARPRLQATTADRAGLRRVRRLYRRHREAKGTELQCPKNKTTKRRRRTRASYVSSRRKIQRAGERAPVVERQRRALRHRREGFQRLPPKRKRARNRWNATKIHYHPGVKKIQGAENALSYSR